MKKENMQAMILAAGFGKRMLPLTNTIPKPLVEVNKKPLLHYTIDKLLNNSIKDIVINTHYLPKEIKSSILGNYPNYFKIIHEDEILETGGGVLNAIKKKYIRNINPFFVLNGDIFWLEKDNSVFKELISNWDDKRMEILAVLIRTKNLFGYSGNGDFNLVEKNEKLSRVTNFDKKKEYVYTGLQLVSPEVFANINKKKFSFTEIFDRTIQSKTMYGLVDDRNWFHIGTIETLKKINLFLKKTSY